MKISSISAMHATRKVGDIKAGYLPYSQGVLAVIYFIMRKNAKLQDYEANMTRLLSIISC